MSDKSFLTRMTDALYGPTARSPVEPGPREPAVLTATWRLLREKLASEGATRVYKEVRYHNKVELFFHPEDWSETIQPLREVVRAQAQVACTDFCKQLGWPSAPHVEVRRADPGQIEPARGTPVIQVLTVQDPSASTDLVSGLATGLAKAPYVPPRPTSPSGFGVRLSWTESAGAPRTETLLFPGSFGRDAPGSPVAVRVRDCTGLSVVSRHALDLLVEARDSRLGPRMRNRGKHPLRLTFEGGSSSLGPGATLPVPDRATLLWPPDETGACFELKVEGGDHGAVIVEMGDRLERRALLAGLTEVEIASDEGTLRLSIDISAYAATGEIQLRALSGFSFEQNMDVKLVSAQRPMRVGPATLRFALPLRARE